MKLIPFNRNKEFFAPMSLFDDFVNAFFREDFSLDNQLMPIDVVETEQAFVIKADLPGIKKENLKVSAQNGELLIETCQKEEKDETKGTIHRQERYFGCYQRLIKLSDNCDSEKINAKLDDGVLTLTIPKTEAKKRQEISVS